MKITKPDYYDRFRCLAGGCPDSCCKEWEVQVDADSATGSCPALWAMTLAAFSGSRTGKPI